MLARLPESSHQFTRRDAGRLIAASVVLVVAMSLILGVDFLPAQTQLEEGRPAPANVFAPRAGQYDSEILTMAAREAARDEVGFQYDFTAAQAEAIAVQQAQAFEVVVQPIDAAFADGVTHEDRAIRLAAAPLSLSAEQLATLQALAPERWTAVRTQAGRVLDTLERTELKETQVALVRDNLAGRMAGDLDVDERRVAAGLIEPLVVANSAYDPQLTETRREQAAAAVQPVEKSWEQNDIIVRSGDRVTPEAFEAIEYFALNKGGLDVARLAGFVLLSILVVGLLLTWTWRFRREFWHRNNVMLLLSLLLLIAVFALKLTTGRTWLPYALPLAAVGMLITVLLDGGAAMVLTALVAVLAAAVNGAGLELAAYVMLSGIAGIVTVRRGDRLIVFVQAGVAIFVVNALVVAAFALLGGRTSAACWSCSARPSWRPAARRWPRSAALR